MSHTEPHDFRPDIQGLRAVAVLLVLAYHLSPARVSGGYVGVDVFFVVSGFLITSHLHREGVATGTVSLARFWERRARRLLPAALLVLAVCLVLTATVLPTTVWDQTLRQVGASALYVQNWALAGDAVAYSAQGNSPTVVQHYWSLSVEEQFYLAWPLLVLAVVVLLRRRGSAAVTRGLLVALSAVGVASLAWSVVLTRIDPDRAYFVTPTRVWEFAAGALLALLLTRARPAAARPGRWPAGWWLLGWAGALGVVGSALLYDESTPFPGWHAAVPVLGTVALLAAGRQHTPHSVGRVLAVRPARFLGDISYAVYLWHWPLVVALPAATGAPLDRLDKVGIVAATIVLAWLSTRFVERPVRVRRSRPGTRWRVLVTVAAAMALVLGVASQLQGSLDRQIAVEADRTTTALRDPGLVGCLGPPALDPANGCASPQGSGPLLVSPGTTARQNTVEAYPGCQAGLESTRVARCTLGERTRPTRTVAVVGDSHAAMWFPAFDRIGRDRGWEVVTYARSSCPFTIAVRLLPEAEVGEVAGARQEACTRSNEQVAQALLGSPEIDTVFVAAFSSAYEWRSQTPGDLDDAATDGFREAWEPLVGAGKRVVALRDVPAVKDRVNVPDCLLRNRGDRMACALPRGQGLLPDAQAVAASESTSPAVGLVDLSPQLCDDRWCYPVVGDVIAYRDYSHLSAEYATLLTPYLVRALGAVATG